jgi:hypothetical protein
MQAQHVRFGQSWELTTRPERTGLSTYPKAISSANVTSKDRSAPTSRTGREVRLRLIQRGVSSAAESARAFLQVPQFPLPERAFVGALRPNRQARLVLSRQTSGNCTPFPHALPSPSRSDPGTNQDTPARSPVPASLFPRTFPMPTEANLFSGDSSRSPSYFETARAALSIRSATSLGCDT